MLIAGQQFEKWDIILKKRDNKLQRISETHRAYDALQYSLMFPKGEDGYSIFLKQNDGRKNVSAMSFYSYRLMMRNDSSNNILHFTQLSNQYYTDMYAKVETERLNFLRHNQSKYSKLRFEDYIHLRDAMTRDGNANNVGQPFIFPSSFTGGSNAPINKSMTFWY